MAKFIRVLITLICPFFLFKLFLSPQIRGGAEEVRRRTKLYVAQTDEDANKEDEGLETAWLVIWDVGQGQWVTLVTPTHCFHFDMGGEFFPKGLKKTCLHKLNEISFTHWDMDHISFVFRFRKRGFRFCVRYLPRGEHSWKRQIEKWPQCSAIHKHQEVFVPKKISQRRNENSLAFFLWQKVLITGDAPAKEERKIHFHSNLKSVRFLVVGHHGSRTSTSLSLLNRLKNLRLAMASARFEKYRHPHPQVQARLKMKKVPLLSTNDWGNLIIEL